MIPPSAFRLPQVLLRKFHFALSDRLSLPTSFRLHTLAALLARLSPREQRFVAAAGVALSGTLLYFLLLDPLWQMHDDLRARVAAKERELQEVIALRQEYLETKATVERAQSAAGVNFSPVAFLENLARSTVGQEKVSAITPTAEEQRDGAVLNAVELRLNGVSLRELVELLYKIETAGPLLHPRQLSMKKRYKDPYTFDVLLTTLAISTR
ncbi:MAG TPA: type II secretion system protein GspM [Methylomirabilota bacterium]|nr:type II secretion system protein GspM [Methylomirabilota bacterium]